MYSNYEKLLKINKTNSGKVAKATGITPSTFTEWKRGTYIPKVEKLQKIADYFGVTLDYLMGIDKFIIEDIEPEYITVIKEAKKQGYSAEDIKLALKLMGMARNRG